MDVRRAAWAWTFAGHRSGCRRDLSPLLRTDQDVARHRSGVPGTGLDVRRAALSRMLAGPGRSQVRARMLGRLRRAFAGLDVRGHRPRSSRVGMYGRLHGSGSPVAGAWTFAGKDLDVRRARSGGWPPRLCGVAFVWTARTCAFATARKWFGAKARVVRISSMRALHVFRRRAVVQGDLILRLFCSAPTGCAPPIVQRVPQRAAGVVSVLFGRPCFRREHAPVDQLLGELARGHVVDDGE
ncbi:hypothetical protein [Kibdelosporangium philippinense]|uniref:hypothetical protein n=1 Tax=Kibdelosporangium philippinense TaxID=211113 RepID=UPI00360772A5